MKRTLLIIVLLLLIVGTGHAQDELPIVVDATQDLGSISPYVYGANYGPWGLVSPDMQQNAASSGVTFFRFPAGHWGDQYDVRPDQIDLYMIQARAWGVEPSISVRLEGGTPEKVAELVRYANIEKQYGIRYWSIGNEPTLYKDYSIEQFNSDWRAMAEAMESVDPTILLIGPEVHQYPSTENPPEYLTVMRQWVREFLRVNGDLVDIVSIHRYPFPLDRVTTTTIEDLRGNSVETNTMIRLLRQDIQDVLGHDMPVAVTEMNSSYSANAGGEASMDSLYNAIWWADVLGRMIQEKVDIAAIWAFYTSAAQGSWGILDRYNPRPTYYVYQLYKQFGTQLIYTQSPDTDVSAYAAYRDDGALTIIVVNLAPDTKSKQVNIIGFNTSGKAEVWRLDADHNADQIESENISGTITVPGQSVTLYVIPA